MGAVEAVALDVGVARRKMADRPGRFRMLDDVVMRENYGIGFRKGDTALRDAVEADLCALADDGTMAALARTYGIEESALLLVGPRRRLVHADETAASVSRPGLLAMGRELLDGLVVSVEIFALTLLLALPLGFVVAFGRMASNRCVSALFRLYISILRGTPLMLQILFVYFAPNILFGLSLESYPRFLATVLAFSFNYAAYFAEIYRGGILSIDAGQREAAAALGLGRVQTFRRIILPQTIKRVLPAVGNEVITLVKDTSLAFTVSVLEMFTIARQLAAAHTTVAPLVAAGVFYYVFNDLVAWLLGRLERRLSYYD
jgi:polar amino acid transport system substrate-binding protein